ncbi:MAG TPA: LysM peptidoglycan-binding domain-containing protein [Burkholderiaceae bacterium]|nr:LysM peptidoglycan-binding domain-containing protein [Burkholderiaceae bacterium]HMX09972.1 LysM peptidoglycan-binding domain-containing protein [Burkholderiaceae bacterium]HNB45665.1 LysM peptidoglycan-binding domain-containing protein [Burkholderiaceae bacterium]HNG78844.1 LysM peptidoglycan-binding domain-containing protein [Burkholderiaceae bacterium]
MILRPRRAELIGAATTALSVTALAATLWVSTVGVATAFPNYPVTEAQRRTANEVAQAGVPLSELAPDAPDSYTVKRGDTLWDIAKLFLRSPWRWPELWGMNLQQIRNPHLIYPGQRLLLVRKDGRAFLQLDEGPDTVKLSPRARASDLRLGAIAAIPLHLIQPFLNDAVVLDSNEFETAPRIVAAREGRVLLSRGDAAYVRGELAPRRDWRIFRNAKPLKDPVTSELLGYEAAYVGSAEYVRPGTTQTGPDGRAEIIPATFNLVSLRQEAGAGDRLAPTSPRDEANFIPHAPAQPVQAQVASIYGDGLSAGQNHIVALNRGRRDGLEPGHVLALLRTGERVVDREDPNRTELKLPDEAHGQVFVFRVFERVSYALILTAQTPVRVGDRCTQP